MRGSDQRSGELFSYVDIEARVPSRHPLRVIRSIVNDVLASLDGEFDKLYADTGRGSIPPERLLRSSLLQAFFSIRSERLLMEQRRTCSVSTLSVYRSSSAVVLAFSLSIPWSIGGVYEQARHSNRRRLGIGNCHPSAY